MGNEAFKCGDFKQAEEYYTSALMQWDKVSLCNISRNYDTKKTQIMFQNYVLFTNRAQTRIKLKKYQDAVDDCKVIFSKYVACNAASKHFSGGHQTKTGLPQDHHHFNKGDLIFCSLY